MQAVVTRMSRELRMIQTEPPPGVWAAPKGDKVTELEAQLQGPKDTVYEGGVFNLSVDIPARYPFEPPKLKFLTPIYHPNIDPEGRICLDILNMPPKGAWKPSLNLCTVLASIGLLLAEPNPEDGLVTDITAEFRHQRQVFDAKARQWTQRHAMQGNGAGGSGSGDAGAPGQAGQDNAQAAVGGAQQQQQQQAPAPGRAGDAGAATGASKENSQPAQPAAAEPSGKQQQEGGKEAGAVAGCAPVEAPAEVARQQQQQPAKRPRLALRK